jgi:predicted 3-demethylubiquinone-9 3-methyltransferase (glyoxalase superfamily)
LRCVDFGKQIRSAAISTTGPNSQAQVHELDIFWSLGNACRPNARSTRLSVELAAYEFGARDRAHDHGLGFNEAISFIVSCDTQEEIDHYWKKLSAVPEAEQCGWLKDKYGVSWQIVPSKCVR